MLRVDCTPHCDVARGRQHEHLAMLESAGALAEIVVVVICATGPDGVHAKRVPSHDR